MPIMMRFLRNTLFVLGASALAFTLVACPFGSMSPAQPDDLALAKEAARDRDIGDAEMYYERYLRKNPSGEHRWEVWQSLLGIALDIRHDRRVAREYLEIMLEEFTHDGERRRHIQFALADVANEMRAYERAVTLWEAISVDPATHQETLADVYRKLSRAYLRRLEFSLSKEVLDRCLRLNVAEETKAKCLYALSEAHMLTDELGPAEQALRTLLDMDIANKTLRIETVFMLADVLEQQDRIPEAAQYFESLRDEYPNPRVIEIRLSALKNKSGAAVRQK